MPSPLVRKIVLPSLVSIVCIAAIGFALFGVWIFDKFSPAVVFSVYGVIFSSFFFTYRYDRRNAFALLLVLFLLNQAIVNHGVRYQLFGRDLIYFSSLAGAIVLYARFFDRSRAWHRWLAPFVVGFMFLAAIFIGACVLYFWWQEYRHISFGSYLQFMREMFIPSVFLVGIGLGIGILLDEHGATGAILHAWKRLRQ